MSKEKVLPTVILILLAIPIVSGDNDLLEIIPPEGKIIVVAGLIAIFILLVIEAFILFKRLIDH